MLTWSKRAGRLTLPTRSGSHTSNLPSKKKLKRHLLSQSEKECVLTPTLPIDTSRLDSTRGKWHRTSLLKHPLTVRPHMVEHSKSLVMLPHSLKSHQNFKLRRIRKKLKRKTIQISLTRGKEDLVTTTDVSSLLVTTSLRTSQTQKSHLSN